MKFDFYLFDIDNTLCDTENSLNPLLPSGFKDLDRDAQLNILDELLDDNFYFNIPLLNNKATNFLQNVMQKNADKVYFITARTDTIEEQTKKYLQKHNLLLNDTKLIMNADNKDEIIVELVKNHEFALMFDDSLSVHKQLQKLTNVFCIYP